MERHRLRPKDRHTRKGKPGHSICDIDRGLARFRYPSDWVVKREPGAIHLHDQEPCVESCDLGVSVFRVPPDRVQEIDLDDALLGSLDSERKAYYQSEVQRIARTGLEIIWIEQQYRDAEYDRDARFRVALARGPAICLISLNYWTDRAADLEPVWDEVLRSLAMGQYAADAASGPVIQ